MKIFHTLLVTTSLVAAAPSWAQPVASTDNASSENDATIGLGDIVVTAQRRSENLQNVPVAVSAVTSDQLAKSNVVGVADLRLAVPALNITYANGQMSTSLRGLGSNGIAPGFENPVAIYVDGVYYASQVTTFLGLANIEQIEVLKGPQGTLFGRNATGGLVQVTTRRPSDSFVMEGGLSYGNYQAISGNAYVAGPAAAGLSADLAVQAAHQGNGWGESRVTGQELYKTKHDYTVRSKWQWEAGDSTSFILIGDYSDISETKNPLQIQPGTLSGYAPANGVAPDLGYDTTTDYRNYRRGWSAGGSLKWLQDIGEVSLVSTTAYRQSRYKIGFDYDGQAVQPGATVDYNWPDRQFSQELQLSSKSGGLFTWVGGAYYFNALAQFDPIVLGLNEQGVNIRISNKQKTTSLAGYLQGTYALGDRTNVTVGGRYTTERRSVRDGTTDIFVVPIATALPTVASPDDHVRFNKFTFRLAADHRFSNEVMAYVSFNRGFKSGGYNTGSPGKAPYRPETIDAYELGLKTDLLDRRLRVNVAGFYYDYKDVQSQKLDNGVIEIVNAARARIYGLDADFQALVADGLRLTGGVTAVRSRYRSYPQALLSTPLGGVPSVIGSAKGNQLPLASKVTFNAALDYKKEYDFGTVNANVNLYYNSGFFLESDNVIKQDRFAQIGATLSWTSSDDRFSLGVFGKNLTDRRVLSFGTTVPNGTHLIEYAAPRTYGVTAGFKFN